jgi:hypothetical protein
MICISQNYLCLKLNKYVIKSGNNVRATLWSVLHQSDHRKIKSSQYLGENKKVGHTTDAH